MSRVNESILPSILLLQALCLAVNDTLSAVFITEQNVSEVCSNLVVYLLCESILYQLKFKYFLSIHNVKRKILYKNLLYLMKFSFSVTSPYYKLK